MASHASSKTATKRAVRAASIAIALSIGLPVVHITESNQNSWSLPSAMAEDAGVVTASTAIPKDPSVAFHEDFESKRGLTPADLTQSNPVLSLKLNAYNYPQYSSEIKSATGSQVTYSGDAYWLNHNQCNGVILNFFTTDAEIYRPKNQAPASGWDEACNGGLSKNLPQTDPGSSTGERIFARNNVRRLAYVLGLVEQGVNKSNGVLAPAATGQNPDTVLYPNGYNNPGSEGEAKYTAARKNDAVTAYSMAQYPNPAQHLVFENSAAFNLTQMNTGQTGARFYTTSVDVAELSCGAANSSLEFKLFTGVGGSDPKTYPLVGASGERIVACTDARLGYFTAPTNAASGHDFQLFSSDYTYWGPWAGASVRGGRFYSADAKLLSATEASSVKVQLLNSTAAHDGNDFAFDNIRIVDATPTLYKEFLATDGMVEAGKAVTLMFNVVNTTDLAQKSGWSFTDQLPQGLKVASTPNGRVEGNCTATFAPTAGHTSITVSNGVLNQGAENCKLYVDVVVDSSAAPTEPGDEATFTNCPATEQPADPEDGYLTASTGVNSSECADVTFYVDPEIEVEKAASPSSADLGPNGGLQQGDDVTYTVSFRNSGRNPQAIAYRDDMSGVLDDATFSGNVTVVTRSLEANGDPGAVVANTVTAVWDNTNKRIDFGGTLAAGTVATATYTVVVKDLQRPDSQTWGDLSLDNCVRPTGQTTGGECTETPVIPPSFVSVTKQILNADSTTTPGQGWLVTIASDHELSGNLAPQSTTATTPASGKVQWELTHDSADTVHELTLSEDPESKPGYVVDSFTCTATPSSGTPVEFEASAAELAVADVAPGTTVDCVVTNKPALGQVNWSKSDQEGVLLEGSQWQLVHVESSDDPHLIDDCVADSEAGCADQKDTDPAAGQFSVIGLVWGTYVLTETKAPAGFERSSQEHNFEISADELTYSFTQPFVNRPREALVIPLTGGTGTHIFTLTSVAVLATAGLFLWRRNTSRLSRIRR